MTDILIKRAEDTEGHREEGDVLPEKQRWKLGCHKPRMMPRGHQKLPEARKGWYSRRASGAADTLTLDFGPPEL